MFRSLPSIRLGAEIARGGEGAIHQVRGDAGLVAKVWHEDDPAKPVKLAAMLSLPAAESLRDISAWPMVPYVGKGGRVAGFVMRRVDGHQGLHVLYTPKSRRARFPGARWPFLVRTALNVARAFSAVHGAGVVIGDVNHSSVLVDERATVTLVDCDSFQVTDGARTFTCDVGVDAYTPPELQGRSLDGVTRVTGHDAFGLAVLVFQLLFLGRHPFAGVYTGKGEMDVSRAVSGCLYAYSHDAASRELSPPPGSLSVQAVGPELGDLFERAFSREAADGRVARPSATEWVEALSGFETSLVRCTVDASHHHSPGVSCPFCALERVTGTPSFGQDQGFPEVRMPDERPCLARLDALPPYEGAEFQERVVERATEGQASPSASRFARVKGVVVRIVRRVVNPVRLVLFVWALHGFPEIPYVPGWILIVAVVLIMLTLHRLPVRIAKRFSRREKVAVDDAEKALGEVILTYLHPATDRYVRAVAAATDGKAKLADLEARRVAAGRPATDVGSWLNGHAVASSGIRDLGAVRLTSLHEARIRTALDVNRYTLTKVEGVGPVLSERLLAWRAGLEGEYRNRVAGAARSGAARAVDVRIAAAKTAVLTRMETDMAQAETYLGVLAAYEDELVERLRPAVAGLIAAKAEHAAVTGV